MSTAAIFNFHQVNERLITGGQPTDEQIRAVAADGFEVVLNIAPIDPRYSLDDERAVVEAEGMHYHHLPVAWDAPTEQDFRDFIEHMDQWAGNRVLVHCAANYRVSAFYALYAMLRQGWRKQQVDEFIAARWNPADYPPWPEFIATTRAGILAGDIG